MFQRLIKPHHIRSPPRRDFSSRRILVRSEFFVGSKSRGFGGPPRHGFSLKNLVKLPSLKL